MAWADTLLDASFRGVSFDCLRTRDGTQRDTASHDYPYLDGSDVEDLGRRARHLTLSAVFFGPAYEQRLQSLMAVLDQAGPGELIHPVFGSVKAAQLLEYHIHHDADNPDACTLELTFVEATPGNPFFVQQLPAQKAEAASQHAQSGRDKGFAAFASTLDKLKGKGGYLARLNALRDVLTGTLGAMRRQVQGMTGASLDLIDFPRAFASDVLSLVSRMADLRSFDADVMQSDWHSLSGQLNNIVQLPARVAATGSHSDNMANLAANSKAIPANAEDIAKVTAVVQVAAATTLAETASQILAIQAEQPTLAPTAIEQIANDVRAALQQSIERHRGLYPVEIARPIIEALKDTALSIQEAAMAMIETQPPLITRTIDAPGNLHLLAFRWYGDYTRAQELARLNPTLTHPNALQVGDTLYAYAR